MLWNTRNACTFLTWFFLFLHGKYGKYNKNSAHSCAHEYNMDAYTGKLLKKIHPFENLVCCFFLKKKNSVDKESFAEKFMSTINLLENYIQEITTSGSNNKKGNRPNR
jgi:hypothetical protein